MWLALGVKVKNGENQFLEPLYSLQVSENGRCGCLWLVAPNIVLFVKQFNSSVGILIKIEMHSCLKWPLSRLPYFGEIYSSPSDKLQSMKARRGGGGGEKLPAFISSASDLRWNLSLPLVYLFECSLQTLAASDLTLRKWEMCYFCSTLF